MWQWLQKILFPKGKKNKKDKKEKKKFKKESVINAISTVGFPIVMCGACAYFLYTIINKLMGQMYKFA